MRASTSIVTYTAWSDAYLAIGQEVAAETFHNFLCEKLRKGYSLVQTSLTELPKSPQLTVSVNRIWQACFPLEWQLFWSQTGLLSTIRLERKAVTLQTLANQTVNESLTHTHTQSHTHTHTHTHTITTAGSKKYDLEYRPSHTVNSVTSIYNNNIYK